MTVYYRYKDWTAEDVRPIDCAVALYVRIDVVFRSRQYKSLQV